MRTLLAAATVLLLTTAVSAVEISPVTIYGKIIMSIDYANNVEDGYFGITSSQSRLGFRGYFDLNEKYRAIWQIESRVRFDLSGDDFASRNTFVGFSGDFGTVKFGRHDTPYKLLNNRTDPFLNRFGDSRNVIGTYGGGMDARADRMIMYESPDIYRAEYKVLYKTEAGQEGTDLLSASVEYELEGAKVWAAGEFRGLNANSSGDSITAEDNEYGLRVAGTFRRGGYSYFALLEGIGNVYGLGGVSKYSWSGGVRYFWRDTWNLRGKYTGTTGRSDIDNNAGHMVSASLDLVLSESALFFFAGSITFNEENAWFNTVNSGLFWTFMPYMGKSVWGFSAGTILAF
jgi:predicted porin